MADFDKSIDLDKAFNKMVDDVVKVAEKLHKEGEEAGEAVGQGVDYGIDNAIKKITASSIKTDKAFKNLGEKIKKQIQQLTTTIKGKDTKIKIDFSDIDINSDAIQKQIKEKVEQIKASDLIDFDTKNFDNQLTNFVTLFVKYQEKFNRLQEEYKGITVPKDSIKNLQQQLVLAQELRHMYVLFGKHEELETDINLIGIKQSLATLDQFSKGATKATGEYDELAKILKEIQSSLKIISDVFKNENNSMKVMAENGKTSFESLSQAIIEVYNNLTQVTTLVDRISKKNFNITNVTTPMSGATSKRQSVKELKGEVTEELKHVKVLYDEIDKLLSQLNSKRMLQEAFVITEMLSELDAPTYAHLEESITGQMANAKTQAKIENILVLVDGYIEKLTALNQLRHKLGLGKWEDPMAKVASEATIPETPITTTATETVKQQAVVDASVEAEKAKLRELVSVITNEVGKALDDIKVKFAQTFVVPELDKNQLQTSFDEIYNKFVELKDKIQTMEIDVGFNTANITTAIQEALYAKEIAKNYTKITSFDQRFDDFSWGDDEEAIDKFTNKILTLDKAREKFADEYYGKFMSQDGTVVGDTNEMLSHLMQKLNGDVEPNQNEWAQVIVEAINTQGSNVVEAIKLLLPKSTTSGVDEAKLITAFQDLSHTIADWSQDNFGAPGDFFRGILKGSIKPDGKTQNALRTLGLITDAGKAQFIMPDTGLRNLGVAIANQAVVSSQHYGNMPHSADLQRKIDEAVQLGAAIPRILDVSKEVVRFGENAVFALQERALGGNITDIDTSRLNVETGVLKATDQQIDKLLYTFEVLEKVGLHFDAIGDNIMFDEKAGFSVLDLSAIPEPGVTTNDPDQIIGRLINKITRASNVPMSERFDLADRIRARALLPPEKRLWNETIARNTAQNESQAQPSEVHITPTMEEGAVAKVVAENVAKTPIKVKVTPVVSDANEDYDDVLEVNYDDLNIVDPSLDSQQAVDNESVAAVDAAQAFIDAANAKKQFVEANKQVAESAKESAKDIEKEADAAEAAKQTMVAVADDTVQPTQWDKISQWQKDHGEDPFALSRSKTDNVGDKSVRTIVESWTALRDEDGELTGEMELNTVKIINDFKKRTSAIEKENEKIKTAKAYLQKFLTQFDNKTMGEGSKLTGYSDLQALVNKNDFKIDDIAKAEQMMSNLDAEYNKVVQSMRKGSSSMNPFVNAINSMDKMEDVLTGISLQFRTLDQQPDWLKTDIINLYKQLDDLAVETDIYKFAEGFGNLKVSINSVTESIRQQRAIQKLTLSDFNALVKATQTRDANTEKAAKEGDGSDWQKYYLDRAAEQQKIVEAISIGLTLTETQEAQLNAMAEKHALILKDINVENNKIEEQKQKYEEIMRLLENNHTNQIALDNGTLKVIDKDAYQQRLNAERAQIDALIKGADLNPQQTKSVQDFVKLLADLRVESSNIDLMSKKWVEQNILTDKAKSKIEALQQALLQITSGSELGLWKKQWKELANEMSMANIDAKEDKQIGKLIEDDRIAKVKKYIDLLKLQHDYQKKAANEKDGSQMQSFYLQQVQKIQEEIQKIDEKSLLNQEEQNQLLAIRKQHEREIAEIKQKQQSKGTFETENSKIQQKYDAGYLNADQYGRWKSELTEYQNYLNGTVQADETTVQQKKQILTRLYDELTKIGNASKTFFTSSGEILPKEMWFDQSQIDNMSKSLQGLYDNIVAERFEGMKTAITSVKPELGKLTFTVDDGSGSLAQYTLHANAATGAVKILGNSVKPTLTVFQRFGQTLKKDFTGLLTAVTGGLSMQTVVNYFRQGIQSVRELDLALTELKKVTDETEETYAKFLDTAAKTGERIGSTLSNVTSATAEFAKLGYNISEAASMAEAALVYTNVGDNMSVETASQSIISTLKAFGIEANNTMSIVDKFNEIGNNFAITTAGIGDALQVSASAMAAAGNTLDETIALTTAAI